MFFAIVSTTRRRTSPEPPSSTFLALSFVFRSLSLALSLFFAFVISTSLFFAPSFFLLTLPPLALYLLYVYSIPLSLALALFGSPTTHEGRTQTRSMRLACIQRNHSAG